MTISKEETARRISDMENWPKILSFPESIVFNPDRGINCLSLEDAAVLMDTSKEHLIAMLEKVGTDKNFPDAMIELEDSETKQLTHAIRIGQSRRVPGGFALSFTGKSEPINEISFLADYEIEILGYAREQAKPEKGA